jgi:hypothetical protein
MAKVKSQKQLLQQTLLLLSRQGLTDPPAQPQPQQQQDVQCLQNSSRQGRKARTAA